MPEIIIKEATKRFGGFVAVETLDITIEDKGFVTLLGPSGCGKTTTLRMISGLESPTEGEIYIDNVLVFSSLKGVDLPPAKRDVEYYEDDTGNIQLVSKDLNFKFKPNAAAPKLKKGVALLLGLRPEHISLTDNGAVKCKVYSTLPSGMETTVILKIENTLLTAVVFGGMDFPVDSEIGLELNHDNYILFDKISQENIATGSLGVSMRDAG